MDGIEPPLVTYQIAVLTIELHAIGAGDRTGYLRLRDWTPGELDRFYTLVYPRKESNLRLRLKRRELNHSATEVWNRWPDPPRHVWGCSPPVISFTHTDIGSPPRNRTRTSALLGARACPLTPAGKDQVRGGAPQSHSIIAYNSGGSPGVFLTHSHHSCEPGIMALTP